jgi:hypothetical protein
MRTVTFETPALYGDHHVKEVRRILTAVPGVREVYASSAFRIVEIRYDEEQTAETTLATTLAEAGYLGDWTLPEETGRPATETTERGGAFFRQTKVYETARHTVSFAQTVKNGSRPLWNCPGFGVIKSKMED